MGLAVASCSGAAGGGPFRPTLGDRRLQFGLSGLSGPRGYLADSGGVGLGGGSHLRRPILCFGQEGSGLLPGPVGLLVVGRLHSL